MSLIKPHIILEPDNIFVAKSKNITVGYIRFSTDPYFKEKALLLALPAILKAAYGNLRGQYGKGHYRKIKNTVLSALNIPRNKFDGAVNFTITLREDFRNSGVEKYMLDVLEYVISNKGKENQYSTFQSKEKDDQSKKTKQKQYSRMIVDDFTYFKKLYKSLGFNVIKKKLSSLSEEKRYFLQMHREI